MRRLSLFPEDVVAVATALKCPSIAYTYSEPTAFYEYTLDTCVEARKAKIKNIIVTCGSIEERPLRRLLEFVDAAHVDLKGFDENIYRQLNSGRLQTILNTLKVYKSTGVWFEIINLIVPTYTDKPETIKRMCGWLVENLGPDVPLHFSRFHPQHKLTHLPPTPMAGNTFTGARHCQSRRPALRLYRQRPRGGGRRDNFLPELQKTANRTHHLCR